MNWTKLNEATVLLALGAVLALPIVAGPATRPARGDGKSNTGDCIGFKDIPALTNGPDQGCYVVFKSKKFDALMLASNLNVLVYLKDKGERIDKPIEIGNRFVYTPTATQKRKDPEDLMKFKGVRKLAPPALNPAKVVITAVSEENVTLIQTWKFADGKIEVENDLKNYSTSALPTMRTYIQWPRTHRFTPNIEKSERDQAVAGYSMRWHAGKTESTLQTLFISYTGKPESQAIGDWVENKGPWGDHKVLLKRKPAKGSINFNIEAGGEAYPYAGLQMVFTCKKAGPKAVKIDPQGFELKVD